MRQKYLILFSLSGLIVSLDQSLKHLVSGNLLVRQTEVVISNFFSVTHQTNSGFVFGWMSSSSNTALKDIFYVGIPVFAMILIVMIFIKLRDNQTLMSSALTFILAGAVGNLIDRIKYGYVVDIFLIELGPISVAPFNLADMAILFGLGMMIVSTIQSSREANRKNEIF